MTEKTFVCLSKSKKNNEYCVAGKLIDSKGNIGEWIRPLNKYGNINNYDCLYADKTYATSLDIITATFIKKIPEKFQTENYLIDSDQYWKKDGVYAFNIPSLNKLCDHPHELWFNNHETAGGKNDQVSPDEVSRITNSLYFIYIDKITIYVSKWESNLKVRGEFKYNGILYNLKITDLFWLDFFKGKELGKYCYEGRYITVSLALDTFGGYHYKLIAEMM